MTLHFRKRVTATVIVCLALAGAAYAVTGGPGHDDAQVLLAAEKDWAKAAADHDADRMAGYMTEDYLEVAWEPAAGGAPAHWNASTKAECVDAVRGRKEVDPSAGVRNLTVHVQGNLAVVSGEYTYKGVNGTYANTWTKRDNRWLLVHSVFP